MKKYIAKQILPEYQESPLMREGDNLRRYTRNLGGDIAKVYGWNVSTGKKKEV